MEVEHAWGSKKFLIYYLFCGVAAGISQLVLSPIFEPALGPTVGASGAIYGVLIAFAAMFRIDTFIFTFNSREGKVLLIILIVFGVISVGGQGNVANLAHLGGAVAGYLYLFYDRRRLQSQRRNSGHFSRGWHPHHGANQAVLSAMIWMQRYLISMTRNRLNRKKNR